MQHCSSELKRCCCELRAGKCWKLRRRAQQQQQKLMSQGESPTMASPSAIPSPSSATTDASLQLDPKSKDYNVLKDRVLLLERVILHTIGFELSIDHPYKFLVDCVQNLHKKRLLEYAKEPPAKGKDGQPLNKSQQNALMVQELAQNSMNFANDSMHTSLCLQFTAREVGTACVYLGGKYSGIKPVGGKAWVELLDGISVEELGTICVQILELVSPRKGAESETQLKAIRKDLDELSKESAAAHAAKRQRTE